MITELSVPAADTKIWRYMDFPKLISLLETGLIFVRADSLGDPWEGTLGLANVTEVMEGASSQDERVERWKELAENHGIRIRQFAVSCWHVSNTESAALWAQYVQRGAGVAIQSTISGLKASLDLGDREAWLGPVEYINYFKTRVSDNPPEFLLRKRSSFSHESELRMIIQLNQREQHQMEYAMLVETPTRLFIEAPLVSVGQATVRDSPGPSSGVLVQANCETLIDHIYVAPQAQPWISHVLKALVKRYDLLPKIVIESSMNDIPVMNPGSRLMWGSTIEGPWSLPIKDSERIGVPRSTAGDPRE